MNPIPCAKAPKLRFKYRGRAIHASVDILKLTIGISESIDSNGKDIKTFDSLSASILVQVFDIFSRAFQFLNFQNLNRSFISLECSHLSIFSFILQISSKLGVNETNHRALRIPNFSSHGSRREPVFGE